MDIQHFREENVSMAGGLGYIKLHPGTAIPHLTIISLAMVCGTLGNILVICAVLLEKKLRTVGNLFIINLAIADLCVTAFVDPFSIVGVVKGESWFSTRPALCNFIGCVCLTSCFCSLLSIGAISLNRYIHICHWPWYNKIYTFRKTILMCVGLWVVCFLAEMPNFLGWGDYQYDKKFLMCVWDRTADLSYALFFLFVGVVLPLVLIAIVYALIYHHLWKRRATIELMHAAQEFAGRERHDIEDHAWMVFICFVAFAVCWLPYALISAIDHKDVYPHALHFYAALLAHCNSSINCVIYGVSNKSFRHAYFRLLGLRHYTKVPKSERATEATMKGEPTSDASANELVVKVDKDNNKK